MSHITLSVPIGISHRVKLKRPLRLPVVVWLRRVPKTTCLLIDKKLGCGHMRSEKKKTEKYDEISIKNANKQAICFDFDCVSLFTCQYWQSIIYVTYIIDSQYWQWIFSERSLWPTRGVHKTAPASYVDRPLRYCSKDCDWLELPRLKSFCSNFFIWSWLNVFVTLYTGMLWYRFNAVDRPYAKYSRAFIAICSETLTGSIYARLCLHICMIKLFFFFRKDGIP